MGTEKIRTYCFFTALILGAVFVTSYFDIPSSCYHIFFQIRKTSVQAWIKSREKKLFSPEAREQKIGQTEEFRKNNSNLRALDTFRPYPVQPKENELDLAQALKDGHWSLSKEELQEILAASSSWIQTNEQWRRLQPKTKFFDEIFRYSYWNNSFSQSNPGDGKGMNAETAVAVVKIHLNLATNVQQSTENLMQVLHFAHLAYSTETYTGSLVALQINQLAQQFVLARNEVNVEKIVWESPLKGDAWNTAYAALQQWAAFWQYPAGQYKLEDASLIGFCGSLRSSDQLLLSLWRDSYPEQYRNQKDLISRAEGNCRTLSTGDQIFSRRFQVGALLRGEQKIVDRILQWRFAIPLTLQELESDQRDYVQWRNYLGHLHLMEKELQTAPDLFPVLPPVPSRIPASTTNPGSDH